MSEVEKLEHAPLPPPSERPPPPPLPSPPPALSQSPFPAPADRPASTASGSDADAAEGHNAPGEGGERGRATHSSGSSVDTCNGGESNPSPSPAPAVATESATVLDESQLIVESVATGSAVTPVDRSSVGAIDIGADDRSTTVEDETAAGEDAVVDSLTGAGAESMACQPPALAKTVSQQEAARWGIPSASARRMVDAGSLQPQPEERSPSDDANSGGAGDAAAPGEPSDADSDDTIGDADADGDDRGAAEPSTGEAAVVDFLADAGVTNDEDEGAGTSPDDCDAALGEAAVDDSRADARVAAAADEPHAPEKTTRGGAMASSARDVEPASSSSSSSSSRPPRPWARQLRDAARLCDGAPLALLWVEEARDGRRSEGRPVRHRVLPRARPRAAVTRGVGKTATPSV